MKTNSLREVKVENKKKILKTILDKKSISKIEIAETCGLSPSTITNLVGELMEENIVIESGEATFTGGRKRTELEINREQGFIIIVELGRKETICHYFDLALKLFQSVKLPDQALSGNEFLFVLTRELFTPVNQGSMGKLFGIGILYKDDLQENDFKVLYSTSLSAEPISLKAALQTQFRVSTIEEHEKFYSISTMLNQITAKNNKNTLHLDLGYQVLISLVINGKIMPFREGHIANLSSTLCVENTENTNQQLLPEQTIEKLNQIIFALCSVFNIELITFSGNRIWKELFPSLLNQNFSKQQSAISIPDIHYIPPKQQIMFSMFAEKLRFKALLQQPIR